MKYLIILLLLNIGCFSNAQLIKGKIYNEDGELLPFANVYVNGIFRTEASSFGVFYLKVELNDTIGVFQSGYEPEKRIISDLFTDTIELDFVLFYKKQALDEVKIEAKGIRKIIDKKNEHVIDFIPLENNDFYILKSYERKYILSYESEQKVIFEKELNFSPIELFLDFLGNVHVLSKDSAYQVYMDKDLYLLPPYSLGLFNSQLRPVIANGAHSIYLNRFTHHRQRYWIDFKHADQDLTSLLMISDSVSEKMALYEYNKLLVMYHLSEDEGSNLIKNGVWDGDVKKLVNITTANQVIWYLKIKSKPLNINSFDLSTSIVTLDFNAFDTYQINKQNNEIQRKKFTYPLKQKPLVLFDRIDQKVYLYVFDQGLCKFYHFKTDSGEFVPMNTIEGISFPKKIKVSNGYAYFLVPVNQFNKMYKMKL